MDKQTYQKTLLTCHQIRLNALSLVKNLGDAIQAAEHADAVGPVLDPTLWINKGKALAEDICVMKAVRDLCAMTR